jgi:hypothetical protein
VKEGGGGIPRRAKTPAGEGMKGRGRSTSSCKNTSHAVDHTTLVRDKDRDDVLVLPFREHLRLVHVHIIPSLLHGGNEGAKCESRRQGSLTA